MSRPLAVPDSIADQLAAAADGDQQAWNALVERYAPLVWSIIRAHRLTPSDADDVAQTVWLRLVESLGKIRDPLALPGWLSRTTRNQCLDLLAALRRATRATDLVGHEHLVAVDVDMTSNLWATQRRSALLAALAELPTAQRRLLTLLLADPPLSYAQISERLGIPVGSIGPTRARALERLREYAALVRFADTDADTEETP